MSGKIFVSYRRDDSASGAAGLRDRLATAFGAANVFMDVDNLLIGQRFDRELEKALAETDVFLPIIGPKWMEILQARIAGDERDYVREEIAGALKRGILVIPILIERALLPRISDLPEDIREMVLHQKHDISHEHRGRDVGALVTGIMAARKSSPSTTATLWPKRSWRVVSALVGAVLVAGAVATYVAGVATPWPPSLTATTFPSNNAILADQNNADQERKRLEDLDTQLQTERDARAKSETENKRLAEAVAQAKRDAQEREARNKEAQRLADAATQSRLEKEARDKAERDRQRSASEPDETRDSQGYILLGTQKAGFTIDRNEITSVKSRDGGFRKFLVKVRDQAITLFEVRVVYDNGELDIIPADRAKLEAGSSFGPIDLKGGTRTIKEIRPTYRTRIFQEGGTAKGEATVEFWAHR